MIKVLRKAQYSPSAQRWEEDNATALELRGLRTVRGDMNRELAQVNELLKSLENARRELEVVSIVRLFTRECFRACAEDRAAKKQSRGIAADVPESLRAVSDC